MKTCFVRCPSGLNFGPTFFLIYVNDLPNGLKTNAKLFVDDNSLFTIAKDKNEVPMLLTMTSQNGLLIGKRFLIQIHTNLLKKFYFQGKRKYRFILS